MKDFLGLLFGLGLVLTILFFTDPEASGTDIMIVALLGTITYGIGRANTHLEKIRQDARILSLIFALKEVKQNKDLREKIRKELFDNSV